MPKFSKRSRDNMKSIHPDLRRVLRLAIQYTDFTVIEGHRSKERQNQLKAEGKSTLDWPKSRHNDWPSTAVDVCPYPEFFNADNARWEQLASVIKDSAEVLGIEIEWGGNWQSFVDKPHFQLKK